MKPKGPLDYAALVAISIAVCFIAFIMRSPFSIGLMIAAVFMCIYGWIKKDFQLIAISWFLPAFGLLAWWANYEVYRITPHTIDAALSNLDFGAAVAIWKWVAGHRLLSSFLSLGYYSLGAAAGVAIAVSKRRSELLKACVIAPILGVPLYMLFPAVGPRWIGHEAARNCFPSMHVAWAIFFWMYTSGKWKWAMGGVLLVTAAATIGLGEHYFIDLVAAAPFAWGVSRLAAIGYSRIKLWGLKPMALSYESE